MDIKTMSLWGLSQAIYEVLENGFVMDEETGEIYFMEGDLEQLNEAIDNKLNGICGFIKMTEAQVETLKARKEEVENNIQYYENRVERLNEFLKNYMETHDISKKELKDYRLGTRKTTSVQIEDEAKVVQWLKKHPKYKKECLKVETKESIIKKGLKELLAQKEIEGANIVEKKNVTIK